MYRISVVERITLYDKIQNTDFEIRIWQFS